MKPPTYTVSTLALALDVDQAQVSRWKAAGMKFAKTGRITLPAAVLWLREHERRERPKGSVSEMSDRRAAAEAELLEIRLERERGSVVVLEAVEQAAEEEALRVRAIVGTLATEEAPRVAEACGCSLRTAATVLRAVADRLQARLATDEDDAESDDTGERE